MKTNNEVTHTPTPWEIEFESRDTFGRQGFSIGHRGKGTIFEMVYTGGFAADSPREHAEFIVRAVNEYDSLKRKADSHEALLAMAKAYYRTLPDDGPEQDHYIRIIEQAEKGA